MEIHAAAALDYTESPPVHYEKTVSMVNTFVLSTVQFVNKFALLAEQKLDEVTKRIQRIDISLAILEAKLNSIQGLEDITAPVDTGTTNVQQPQAQAAGGEDLPAEMPDHVVAGMLPPPPTPPVPGPPPPPPDLPADGSMTYVSQHPRYKQFFVMLRVGVPPTQVEQKMRAEGLDSALLHTPEALIPLAGGAAGSDSDFDDSEEDDDDFSDDDDSDDYDD